MSFTTDQLAAIERAIASGELKVVSNGQEVVYRSMDDLIKARNMMLSALQSKKRKFSFVSRRMT